MAEKKSILEEALLDIKNINNALNANTKEILRSVAREEIDSVVKESLVKEIYEEEDLDQPETDNLGMDADAATSDVAATGGEESQEGGLDDIQGSEEVAPTMEPETGMNADALGGSEMDMTTASDDDVIAIYKKLSGEDEIEIVGDEIHLNISEPGEYVVKAADAESAVGAEPEMGMDPTSDVDYEIEMGDEEGGAEQAPADLVSVDDEEGAGEEETGVDAGQEPENASGDEEEKEEELTEAIPVGSGQAHRMPYKANLGQPKGAGADNLKESKSSNLVLETTKKYNALLTESKKMKAENEQFRAALKQFRNKLVETVVFNSNLTYVTKLFMEHSTTKGEKQNIIKRFDDEVSSLKESQKLYKTIVNELGNRKPINESVENKIIKEVTTGASKQLTEHTAYVDPSTKRIMDLINRVEKRQQ